MRYQTIPLKDGLVVYCGSQETEADRNKRAFNYGFNDYVRPIYAGTPANRSYYEYRDSTRGKVEPYRSWMIYGFLYAAHYYEIEAPTVEPALNRFMDSCIYPTLDFNRAPPGLGFNYDPEEVRHIFMVRSPGLNDRLTTVLYRYDNETYGYDELEAVSIPGVSEWVNFCWWQK